MHEKKNRAACCPSARQKKRAKFRKQEVNFRLHNNRVTLQQDTIMGP